MTSIDGQTDSDVVVFARPPLLDGSCSVTGTVLTCTTNNVPDSLFCLIDMSEGFSCSTEFELQTINIQVGSHVLRVFIRDQFFQQVDVDINFDIVSDLQIECQEVDRELIVTRVTCESEGGIGSVSFTCSIDTEPAENCKLNVESVLCF